MRMGDEGDQKIVRAAVSDPANRLLGFLPALGTREALAFGAGVPVATRLRFKELPEAFIPRSEAVWGGRMEGGAAVDRNLVAEVVARWRGIAMSNKPAREADDAGPGAQSARLLKSAKERGVDAGKPGDAHALSMPIATAADNAVVHGRRARLCQSRGATATRGCRRWSRRSRPAPSCSI